MAETVTGLALDIKIIGQVVGDDNCRLLIDEQMVTNFSDGTGTNQIGTVWQDLTRSLAATSEDHDFAGSRTDFQGAAIAGTAIKFIFIRNLSTTAGQTVKLKPGSSNPVTGILGGTTPTLTIGPGGFLLLSNPIDGYTVTGGSADTIAIETSATSSYRIIVGVDNT